MFICEYYLETSKNSKLEFITEIIFCVSFYSFLFKNPQRLLVEGTRAMLTSGLDSKNSLLLHHSIDGEYGVWSIMEPVCLSYKRWEMYFDKFTVNL